ncbi:peptidoglycan hydrolase CwlO-like protein [Cytobacillus eiseniae]|uniref:Peptidoglycan hydrolase CwlO-like protein n=1 Tax=Cytobacillus eiseniae TaxID=762947 RepID=A0ABS4R9J9_9BACI|nr:C40 family peptidase [Cytobacillus eiseniae]MBP2239570.1 peptidoglycan hydrolase CwlO-like protein [Cytobacillus eiseniae]
MKKQLVILNTTIMLGLGSTIAIPSVSADSLQNQKSTIQKERQGVQSNLSKAEQELTAILEEMAKLDAQVKRIDQAILDNNNLIVKTETDIVSINNEIEVLKKEKAVIQERIDKRSEILKVRAVSYQENGSSSMGYVEVLLGSTSFGDFIERVGAVTKIVQADQEILAEHEADKKILEENQAAIEQKLTDLQDKKVELEGMQALMEEQKIQNVDLKTELESKENEIVALKNSLQMKDGELAAKESIIKQRIASQFTQESIPASGNNSSSKGSSPSYNPPVVTGDISSIISAGYKYIGNSVYVFGGGRTASDIANGRFDCSGFVSWAFAQGGISLPASTSSLRNSGSKVSASDLKPGDLVFFDTYKKDGHVGIYVGGGRFIGSQNSTGVAIASMTSGYWKNHFNGHVRRI